VTLSDQDLLGPKSLHWRYAGDNRVMLMQVKAAMLQLMHPSLGAGVQYHSRFFAKSFEGITASVPEIQGMTFDWPHNSNTARRIRARHLRIEGVDEHGRSYSALEPDTYFWAHATMFDMMIEAIEVFERRLDDAEKERLYSESLVAYRLYGISDLVVPKDREAFQRYFYHMCAEVLEMTPAAIALLKSEGAPGKAFPGIPASLYMLIKRPLGRAMWRVGLGRLPPVLRAKVGRTWTRRDACWLWIFSLVVKILWRVLPDESRYSAASRSANERVAGMS
jgi:uncharacterized protein (DUF2236 family)